MLVLYYCTLFSRILVLLPSVKNNSNVGTGIVTLSSRRVTLCSRILLNGLPFVLGKFWAVTF